MTDEELEKYYHIFSHNLIRSDFNPHNLTESQRNWMYELREIENISVLHGTYHQIAIKRLIAFQSDKYSRH